MENIYVQEEIKYLLGFIKGMQLKNRQSYICILRSNTIF